MPYACHLIKFERFSRELNAWYPNMIFVRSLETDVDRFGNQRLRIIDTNGDPRTYSQVCNLLVMRPTDTI